jgi:hypothetical protein
MASQPGDYASVRKDIAAQLNKPDYDDGSTGPVFLRLAWSANSCVSGAFPHASPRLL